MKNKMIQHLLTASDGQLDARMKPYIEKWGEEPAPIQILEVLDHCVHSALASGFVIKLLQIMYETACKEAKTTHEEVVKFASWRDKL